METMQTLNQLECLCNFGGSCSCDIEERETIKIITKTVNNSENKLIEYCLHCGGVVNSYTL